MPTTAWRGAVIAMAAAASGCWSEACVDADQDLCANDVGSIWTGTEPGSEGDVVNGVRCDVRIPFTTCSDEGYDFACHGAWSRGRC